MISALQEGAQAAVQVMQQSSEYAQNSDPRLNSRMALKKIFLVPKRSATQPDRRQQQKVTHAVPGRLREGLLDQRPGLISRFLAA